MTTPPRTGLRRLWYVASWRARYWWLDTRAGLVAQLLVSLAFAGVGCWSAWRGYTAVVDFGAGEMPMHQAIADWVVYAIMFVVSIIVSLALAPTIKGSRAQKVQVPVVEDGAVIRRIYGPVWIKDPIMLAFKPTGTVAIRKKAGKSWKLKTKWQTVGYHYEYIFQFGLCRGMLDSVLAIRAGDKEVWSGQLTSSGIVSVNKPNLWGGEDAEGGIVGDFEFAFGNPDQAPSSYLAANVAPQQSAYRWRPYATFRGGRWGNSPYPKAPAFQVSRILQGWDGGECWYPEKAEVDLGEYLAAQRDWRYLVVDNSDEVDRSAEGFNDSSWSVGRPPFADKPWPTDGPGTPGYWGFASEPATVVPQAKKVWMRTSLPLTSKPEAPRFQAFVDNDAILYINGVKALEVGGNNGAYYDVPIDPDLFRIGENSIAVVGWDRHSGTGNWFWFDWRLRGLLKLSGMNIAHVLYDSLTAREMDGEPVALVNDASWRAAADRLHAEGFGIGTQFVAGEETIEQFQQRLCDLAGARMSVDPITGQWHLDLIRSDVPDDILVITDDDVLEFEEQPGLLDEAVNQVTARWTDVRQDELRATAPVQALGAIQAFGSVNSEVFECPEVLDESLALRLAGRNLDARATPLKRYALKVARVAYRARPGQKARLQLPKRGIADMVVVLGDISRGTLRSGAIALTAVQDVAGMPDTTYVVSEPGVDTSVPQEALPAPAQRVFEAPYAELVQLLTDADLAYMAPTAGYATVVAADPGGGIDYQLWTSVDGGEYGEAAVGLWCPTALVVEASATDDPAGGLLRTEFTLSQGSRLGSVALGTAALWGEEIVRVDALDVATGAVTLARGCVDTVPQSHAAGERVWFYDDFGTVDPVERRAGQLMSAKVLTRTGSDQLNLVGAPASTLELASRQARPYPPGKVQINGQDYPLTVLGVADISWAHRDRLQQGASLVDTSAADIGPEPGVTYSLEVFDDQTDALLHSASGISGKTYTLSAGNQAPQTRLELWAVRDGLTSLYRHITRWIQEVRLDAVVPPAAKLQSYSATIEASGMVAPISWSVASGALPAGLHLSTGTTTTATISGVVNSAVGYFAAGIRAEDSLGSVRILEISIPVGEFVSLLHFDGSDGGTTFNDQTGRTWTRTSAVTSTAQKVFGTASYYAAATGRYLSAAYDSALDLSTADFTIQGWVRPTGSSGASEYGTIFSKRNGGNDFDYVLYRNQSDGRAAFSYGVTGTGRINLTSQLNALPVDVWTHVAVTRRGDTLAMYINGQRHSEQTFAGSIRNRSIPLTIGRSQSYSDSYWIGWMDELSIVKGAALYSGESFPVPAAPADFPVSPAPLAVTGSLPSGMAGTPYSSTADVTIHGTGSPFTVAVVDGALPSGWSATVNGAHVEVGGPGIAAGTYTFTLEVEDAALNAVYLPLTVTIV